MVQVWEEILGFARQFHKESPNKAVKISAVKKEGFDERAVFGIIQGITKLVVEPWLTFEVSVAVYTNILWLVVEVSS